LLRKLYQLALLRLAGKQGVEAVEKLGFGSDREKSVKTVEK
jgi:hypothetical protein